jgi:hypothetical protein
MPYIDYMTTTPPPIRPAPQGLVMANYTTSEAIPPAVRKPGKNATGVLTPFEWKIPGWLGLGV